MSDQDLVRYLHQQLQRILKDHPRTVTGQASKQTALRELRARIEQLEADEPSLMRVTR